MSAVIIPFPQRSTFQPDSGCQSGAPADFNERERNTYLHMTYDGYRTHDEAVESIVCGRALWAEHDRRTYSARGGK